MEPEGFFPTIPDLADILGRTDFDFDNSYFFDLVESKISRFPGSRFPEIWPGPGLGRAGLGWAWAGCLAVLQDCRCWLPSHGNFFGFVLPVSTLCGPFGVSETTHLACDKYEQGSGFRAIFAFVRHMNKCKKKNDKKMWGGCLSD